MQFLRAVLLACATLAIVAPCVAGVATDPLGTVVTLLQDLSAKITAEGAAEAKAYAEFVEWCDDAAKNTKFELQTAQTKKEQLEASIGKATGDAEASSATIEDLASSISTSDGELKSATAVRAKELKDFGASEAELMESVDALGRATTVLSRQAAKNPAALAQVDTSSTDNLVASISAVVSAASLSSTDGQKLVALVQSHQAGTDDDMGAPSAAAYKSHSGNILDVLEDLKEKAEEQLSNLRKAETNAKHNYDMLKQSLEDQINADEKAMADEKAAKAASLETKAGAEGDLAVTIKDISDANKRLELANSNCMQVAADHEATVAARTEELKVIAEAKQLLTSTSSGAVQQTYSFFQFGSSASARGRSRVGSKLRTRADLANVEVVALVKQLAKQHHSAALAQLASRINAVLRFGSNAGEDPFAKVRSLIAEMISKLEAQAGSEATEKAYCDEQIAKTDAKTRELNYDISKKTSKIDQDAAAAASLKTEVQDLQAELAALAKSTVEMNKIRGEEHAAFVKAKADLELGLQGVRKAIGVLREYYGPEGAAALVQSDAAGAQPAMPEKHTKALGAGGSIVSMLEVVESDFARNLAAEETEEDDAQSQYDTLSQQNRVTSTLKNQDVKYKTQEFKNLDKNVAELSGERDTTNTELAAVLEYDAKIKARCIAKPETYEERKRRRTEEIAGLKQALSILEDEVAFVQHKKRGGRAHRFLAPTIE